MWMVSRMLTCSPSDMPIHMCSCTGSHVRTYALYTRAHAHMHMCIPRACSLMCVCRAHTCVRACTPMCTHAQMCSHVLLQPHGIHTEQVPSPSPAPLSSSPGSAWPRGALSQSPWTLGRCWLGSSLGGARASPPCSKGLGRGEVGWGHGVQVSSHQLALGRRPAVSVAEQGQRDQVDRTRACPVPWALREVISICSLALL